MDQFLTNLAIVVTALPIVMGPVLIIAALVHARKLRKAHSAKRRQP